MKAIVCTAYGSPDVLELRDVAKPVPGDHDVLIKVHATTAHRGDVRIRRFDVPRGQRFMARLVLGFTRPKNPILGMELAGVVESVGKDVTLFKPGDEVFGFTGWGLGAYAEYACIREKPRKSVTKDGMLAGRMAFGGRTSRSARRF
jgi:NADPH:quinone reductase-like Zn-dependent oxidoreductase